MKKILLTTIALAAFATAPATFAQSMVKIGTVDMKKVFEGYYKTKDAESRVNDARNGVKKELDDKMDVFNKKAAEIKKLEDTIRGPELSGDAKQKKLKEHESKINDLKTMEKEIIEFRSTREKQVQDQIVRMRGGIVEDITKVVDGIVKEKSYDVVFDKSGPSLNGVPVTMFAKPDYDFTDDVIKTLNANKGKEAAAAPISSEEGKKDEKKK